MQNSKASKMFDSQPLGHVICSNYIDYNLIILIFKGDILPKSATSLRPLRSMDRRELFVPRTRTTMAMSRSFAVIAPSLWNRLPPSSRASLLSSNLSTSLSLLKTCLFSWS